MLSYNLKYEQIYKFDRNSYYMIEFIEIEIGYALSFLNNTKLISLTTPVYEWGYVQVP